MQMSRCLSPFKDTVLGRVVSRQDNKKSDGCDGSVLLDSTHPNVLTEKSALLNNNSLRGFEQIDEIKMQLECACPGVVSCADILALVARDATVKVGGWSWPVFLGRIDGAGSFADEVNGSLPERRDKFTKLVNTFAKVGLDAKDMIILSDVALLSSPLGVEYALKAVLDPNTFLFEFGMAMIKMGSIPASDPYGWRQHCAFTEPKL
ncbi:hypothetical protein AXG93_2779s1010 [Marchantia polymorpha subsp. ruderalis]|uniref:Plant heme peroxidase family profile domain-containing protein n=1 Tax=Marchantia polymorpha subsp. ruderalis TaxID=1480154 RepID=A0A176W4H4_MARPO|nr:hypothetical protein AXG93_2779s1010 [Marchantia polymorpha subsp. ruderalis]